MNNLPLTICFCGDIMPGGVLPYQNRFVDKVVLSYLSKFDLRIGTLECSIGTDIPFDREKMSKTKSIVFARNEDAWRLKELGVDVVSLANNHALDLGLEGLENTMQILDSLGIKYCGAGHDIKEAKKPAVISLYGKNIAIIGCMFNAKLPYIFHKASQTDYGVYQEDIEIIEKDIQEAKLQYDYVFVMPHWGEEHSYLPPKYCKDYAKRMLFAGADCIIGSHPHIINPVVKWYRKKCYFSLGNFLFPEKCMQEPRPMFYPATVEECLSLKRMWTYPKIIQEPVVAVWKPKNRIGMVAEIEINGRIRSNYKLICLTSDNVLHQYKSFLIRWRMAFWAMLMHLPKYSLILRLYKHRYNIFRLMADKLPSFNIPVDL